MSWCHSIPSRAVPRFVCVRWCACEHSISMCLYIVSRPEDDSKASSQRVLKVASHHDRDDPNSRSQLQKICASADSRVRSLSSGKARPQRYNIAKGDYLPFGAHKTFAQCGNLRRFSIPADCSGLLQSCSSSGTHTHSKPRKLFTNEHTFHISFHAPDQHQTCNACVRTLDIINAHAHKIRELRGSPLEILPYPQPADWLLR